MEVKKAEVALEALKTSDDDVKEYFRAMDILLGVFGVIQKGKLLTFANVKDVAV
jgi:hypothetical protein